MAIRRTPDAAGETKRTRANTGAAEQEMRAIITAWGRKKYGDVRVIHELQLGRRRIDMALVAESDIIGFEIKGPRDSLGDGRLDLQMAEYNFYLPEVWLAVHPKWRDHKAVIHFPNLMVIDGDNVIVRLGRDPHRDEMCCSRLIERLWDGEARRIAIRRGLVQEQLADKFPGAKIRKILARMLTGHEIMQDVCRELRARPLTGLGSDPPVSSGPLRGEIPTKGLATTPDAR